MVFCCQLSGVHSRVIKRSRDQAEYTVGAAGATEGRWRGGGRAAEGGGGRRTTAAPPRGGFCALRIAGGPGLLFFWFAF